MLLPKVLMYVEPKLRSTHSYLNPTILLILFIMITLAFSYYLIKRNIATVPTCKKVKAPRKAYSLMPVVFVVFALNDIIAPAALQQMSSFRSISFYRIGILLSALYYFVTSILVHIFEQSKLLVPTVWMAFISVCIVILFFILSPFFFKMLYSGEWIDDAYREDVSQCSRLEAKLKDYKLTPAEIEVCSLLLDGYTLRQISGMQSRAYATINTYCTSIYRKLNINSRTELLILLQEYK